MFVNIILYFLRRYFVGPSLILSMLCPMVRLKLIIVSALGRLILYALHQRFMISLSNSSAVDARQGAAKATSRAKAANAAYGLFEFFHNHDLGSINLNRKSAHRYSESHPCT